MRQSTAKKQSKPKLKVSLKDLVDRYNLDSPISKENSDLKAITSKLITTKVDESLYPSTDQDWKKYLKILARVLRVCSDMYYHEGISLLSDDKFDLYKEQLLRNLKEYPEIKQEIETILPVIESAPSAKVHTFKHKTPMLSQSKVTNIEDLAEWCYKIWKKAPDASILIEPKIDGVALKLIYEHSFLTHVATRGDGKIGEDHIQDVLASRPIVAKDGIKIKLEAKMPDDTVETGFDPNITSVPAYVEVVGEAIVTKTDFEEINKELEEQGKPTYATERHAAVGLINAGQFKRITYIIHGVNVLDPSATDEMFNLQWLKYMCRCKVVPMDNFYRIEPITVVTDNRLDAFLSLLQKQLDYYKEYNEKVNFATDGIVYKVDSYQVRELLGSTKQSPRWSMAYKFEATASSSKLDAVEWGIGRTGTLTPVARFKPVQIGGVYISAATLHNPKKIRDLDLHIGDIVQVARANEVIPVITNVVKELRPKDAKPVELPTVCPVCGTGLVMIGAKLTCPNSMCKGKLKDKIMYLTSKQVFDMPAFRKLINVTTLENIIQSDEIRYPEDILKWKLEDLKRLVPMPASFENQPKKWDEKLGLIIKDINRVIKDLTWKKVLLTLSIAQVNATFIDSFLEQYDPNQLPQIVPRKNIKFDKKFAALAVFKRFEEAMRDFDIIESIKFFKTFDSIRRS